MTLRSHLFGLMERKLAAGLVTDRARLVSLSRQAAEAQRLADRLRALLAERRTMVAPATAGDLRTAARLGAELAAECHGQGLRAADLRGRLDALRAELARKDRQRETLSEAAALARQTEAEARESRAQAALIAPRRR